MVAGEAILSCPNAIKPLVSTHTPLEGSGCDPWCLSPPVGECCPLVGVPPSATTEGSAENTEKKDIFQFSKVLFNKNRTKFASTRRVPWALNRPYTKNAFCGPVG